jgi:2-dehydropantoate 2-reductase
VHRYVVIGAGAIGGTLAGVLTRAGVPVVLVARGRNAEVLESEGLAVHTPDGSHRVPVTVASSAGDVALTESDVLVFATKTQQLDTALQEWVDRPLAGSMLTAGEALPVLTALNGVAAEEKALRYFARVYGVCVWCPAVHVEPGEVIVRCWPTVGQFHVARWPAAARTDEDTAFLEGLQRDWTAAGAAVRLPDDVAPWKYNKLLTNLGNAIRALADGDADIEPLRETAVAEGVDVLHSAGIDFVSFEESQAARRDGPTPRAVPGFADVPGDSTSQSLSRRTGDVETDFLNGEIVRIAHRHGLAAPVNAALTRAARAAARSGSGPGGHTASELAALIAR